MFLKDLLVQWWGQSQKLSRGNGFAYVEGAKHVANCNNSRKMAFTLAEVLITLGIIGVVVAMTMPSLIANYQKKVTANRLKKSYSLIGQSLKQMQAANEGIEPRYMPFVYKKWEHPSYLDLDMFVDEFSNYIGHVKVTKTNKKQSDPFIMCMPEGTNKVYRNAFNKELTGGLVAPPAYVYELKDGSCLGIMKRGGWNWGDDGYLYFWVDIDGNAGANKLGRDLFLFQYDPDGVYKPVEGWQRTCRENNSNNGWNVGVSCSKYIMDSNWEIPKIYPW